MEHRKKKKKSIRLPTLSTPIHACENDDEEKKIDINLFITVKVSVSMVTINLLFLSLCMP